MRKQVLQLTIEMLHLKEVSFRADDLGSISPMTQISRCDYLTHINICIFLLQNHSHPSNQSSM